MAVAFHESFDNGVGAISNAWNIDTSVDGQVTLRGSAAMMEWAVGPEAGHGYGTYTIHAKLEGNVPGAGIVLWPGDNEWPGQEIDMAEIAVDGSGRHYGTVHWNAGGHDAYTYKIYDGVQGGVFHDYQMVWEPGKITFKVDGAVKGTITENVPVDYEHGGMNNTIGFLNNNDATSITVTDVDFRPLGSSAPVVTVPVAPAKPVATTPEPSTAAPAAPKVDWEEMAAVVSDYHADTGIWASYEDIMARGAEAPAATPAPAKPAAPVVSAPAAEVGWEEMAAVVSDYHAETGRWASYDEIMGFEASQPAAAPAPTKPAASTGATDWNMVAQVVDAYHTETGVWASYDQILDSGWIM